MGKGCKRSDGSSVGRMEEREEGQPPLPTAASPALHWGHAGATGRGHQPTTATLPWAIHGSGRGEHGHGHGDPSAAFGNHSRTEFPRQRLHPEGCACVAELPMGICHQNPIWDFPPGSWPQLSAGMWDTETSLCHHSACGELQHGFDMESLRSAAIFHLAPGSDMEQSCGFKCALKINTFT